jgi:enoyl-CoA hydratase
LQKTDLKVERESGIALIQIDRPEVRNALDPDTYRKLGEALTEVGCDRNIRSIIITGAGDKVFASGSDVKMISLRTHLENLDWIGPAIFSQIEMLPKPVIAAINGYALGAGCELALACDLRIASRNAKFGQPEVKIGILPGGGGTQRLPRIVGLGKAKELIFTGEIIDAQEAYRIGLVNKVVESSELIKEAKEMANRIMKNAPLAVRLSKMAMNAAVSTDINTGMQLEKLAQTILFSTEDRKEGTSSFLEKRSPSFKGQ